MSNIKPLATLRVLLLCSVVMLLPDGTMAQEQDQQPKVQVSDMLEEMFRSNEAVFYSFNYPSKNVAGEDIVLSSSLIAWAPYDSEETDSIESLHIYSHYTITADRECPTSKKNIKDRLLFTSLVGSHYGIGQDSDCDFISHCVVIAPDYEGYGVTSSLPHPYLAQELTAQQVMDGVTYGLQLYQKLVNEQEALPFKSDWRTFAYGFSQGGAVTLAVQRLIERQQMGNELHFRGSLCGDGPYDLLATMHYYIYDDGSNYGVTTDHQKGFTSMPQVVPMIIKGMLDSHPDLKHYTLEDYLSQQFLDTGIIDWIQSKTLTTNEIAKNWYQQLQTGFDTLDRHYSKEQMAEMFYSPEKDKVWGRLEKMFTPAFYEYLLSKYEAEGASYEAQGDARYEAMYRALTDNSVCTGWDPMYRIQFLHSKKDMTVPYSNYLAFCEAHPDGEGTLYKMDNTYTSLDHVDAGTVFFLCLTTTGTFGKYFKWLDQVTDIAGIGTQHSTTNVQRSTTDYYTLDGQRLKSRPTRKGIYIRNNRLIIID